MTLLLGDVRDVAKAQQNKLDRRKERKTEEVILNGYSGKNSY